MYHLKEEILLNTRIQKVKIECLARQDIVQESYCQNPGVGVGGGGVRRQQYSRECCRYRFETSHTDLISINDPVYQVP